MRPLNKEQQLVLQQQGYNPDEYDLFRDGINTMIVFHRADKKPMVIFKETNKEANREKPCN